MINQSINEDRTGANAYNTTYTYDPLGNRLVKNDSGQITKYSYNAGNELTLLTPPSGAPTTSAYDANGNLLAENAGGALTTYAWDFENRLIGVSSPSGVETYSYSADGMREEKENSSGTVYYVRDGDNVLIETDAGLITQAHYTDFPGVWGGLASERRGGVSSFYGFDQQANARILVSPAGAITDSYLYKAFGEEVAVSGATVNSLRFGGQVGYWRDEAERVYVRARNLRTDLGRWVSGDPIGFWGGDLNLYRYVKGNPLIAVDPSGYCLHLPFHNCIGRDCHGDPYCKPAHNLLDNAVSTCENILKTLEYLAKIFPALEEKIPIPSENWCKGFCVLKGSKECIKELVSWGCDILQSSGVPDAAYCSMLWDIKQAFDKAILIRTRLTNPKTPADCFSRYNPKFGGLTSDLCEQCCYNLDNSLFNQDLCATICEKMMCEG